MANTPGMDANGAPIDYQSQRDAASNAWNKTLTDINMRQQDIYNQYGYTGNNVTAMYGNGQDQKGGANANLQWDPTNQHSDTFGLLQNFGTQEQNAAKSALFRGLGNTGLGNQQVSLLHQQQGLGQDALKSALLAKLSGIGNEVSTGNTAYRGDILGVNKSQQDAQAWRTSHSVSEGGTLADPTAWDNLYKHGTQYIGNDAMDRLKTGTWNSPAAALSDLTKTKSVIQNLIDNMGMDGFDSGNAGRGSMGNQQIHDLITQYQTALTKSGISPDNQSTNIDDLLMKYNSYYPSDPVSPTAWADTERHNNAQKAQAALVNQHRVNERRR